MKTIKGPAIFLAQFASDAAPFNQLNEISRWAASLGYKGVQIPSWDARLFDLRRAAESRSYCDDIRGELKSNGVEVTELSTHLQGQLIAVHPAYDQAFDGFAPDSVRRNPSARQEWAVEQLRFTLDFRFFGDGGILPGRRASGPGTEPGPPRLERREAIS